MQSETSQCNKCMSLYCSRSQTVGPILGSYNHSDLRIEQVRALYVGHALQSTFEIKLKGWDQAKV